MKDINITMSLDDIIEVRENGSMVVENVYFTNTLHNSNTVDDNEYERVCNLSASTLYRNGEAHWDNSIIDTGNPRVHVEFEYPTLSEMIDAELEYIDTQYAETDRIGQQEWLDGQRHQLLNIKGFLHAEFY